MPCPPPVCRVPDDVAVVGFDDIESCSLTVPSLSSVSQHFDEVGALAGRLLLAEIAGQSAEPHAHRAASAFVARRSCGCAGGDVPSPGQRAGDALEHAAEAAATWEAHARTYLARTAEHDETLLEHYEVGLRLLGQASGEPRRLEWMAATRARAGCLALWDGPPEGGRLRIVGTYDAEQLPIAEIDEVFPVEQFPPRALVRRADTQAGQVTFVIPVHFDGTDWGLLALVGDVDTRSASARETYNQWAALLAVALAREDLHESVRRSEERYSLVAEATNDGLWDWTLAQDSVYYSARCFEMLGVPRRAGAAASALWLDAVHPDDRDTLYRALTAAAHGERRSVEVEHRLRGTDGAYRYVLCRAIGVGDAGHIVRLVGSLADVDQRKQLEERLRQAALYDDVTKLPNRKLFLERLAFAIAQSRRSPELTYAVLFLDLDEFKLVNDSLGHLAGDRLLSRIGSRLRQGLREVDLVARFGGDEFAVLLHDIDPVALTAFVERLQNRLAEPIALDDHEIVVTASVGMTTSAVGYTNPEDTLRDADIAMYRAKSLQRGSHVVFDPGLHDGALSRDHVPA